MAELTRKQQRIIGFALDRLFGQGSFIAPSSLKDVPSKTFFIRELRLTGNRLILLSDDGLTYMRRIVGTIDEADIFDDMADYSDIGEACRHIIKDLLSKGMMPSNATEFIELLRDQVKAKITNYMYAVPLFGVELDGIDVMNLGSMKIARSPISDIKAAGIDEGYESLLAITETTMPNLWLLGSAKGTPRVAQGKFREKADLAAGMLAISAASMYERGASAFRIGVVMAPEYAQGRAIWLSWNSNDPTLSTHYDFGRSQLLEINATFMEQFTCGGVLERILKIFESDSRTQLENAIMRAVYWFSDAQRDVLPVMKFIKYWSCIETFFSDDKNITQSLSIGITSVLVFGGFGFVPKKEYGSFKKRISQLYDLRSRAIHGAAYHHISEHDVGSLSQWAAWMLINMVSFVERGYTKVDQIKATADRLGEELA